MGQAGWPWEAGGLLVLGQGVSDDWVARPEDLAEAACGEGGGTGSGLHSGQPKAVQGGCWKPLAGETSLSRQEAAAGP